MKNKQAAIFGISSFVLFLFSAIALVLGTEMTDSDTMNGITIVFVILFWLFLIVGTVLAILGTRSIKHSSKKSVAQKLPGIITFFSNRLALVTDIVMILFIVLFALTFWLEFLAPFFNYVFAAAVLFICLHCLFNGKGFNIYISDNLPKATVVKGETK